MYAHIVDIGSTHYITLAQKQEKDEQLWKIIEVTSSVNALIPVSTSLDEELSYRIRSLNGSVVLDMSLEGDPNVVTARRLDGNESQRVNLPSRRPCCCSDHIPLHLQWKVKAKGNDKYEITNAGKYRANKSSTTPNGFLGRDNIENDGVLHGVNSFEWDVGSVGGFAYV